jgi:hypothetical protein
MLRKPATRPIRPRVKIPTIPASRIFQQVQLAFQVGIENGAPNAMRPQATSQSRNPARRLAGLGDGGVDEKEVGDGLPPFVSKRGFAICCLRRNDRMRVSGIGKEKDFIDRNPKDLLTLNPIPYTLYPVSIPSK